MRSVHRAVETQDAVRVALRPRVQDVKKRMHRLKEAGCYGHSLRREVFRPWGSDDSIESGPRFQVKRLKVKPGAVLSPQLHHDRAEHWALNGSRLRSLRQGVSMVRGWACKIVSYIVSYRICNNCKINKLMP